MKKYLLIILLVLFTVDVYAADTKLTGLTDITSPASSDDMYIVGDPDSTPASKKINVGVLLGVATDLDTGGAVSADAVALSTDTTGNYAGGDAEAGNALTGDSATSFFSSGTIEHERGGLEADVSGYTDGLYGQASGATADIDTEGELETALGGIDVIVSTEIDTFSEIDAIVADEALVAEATTNTLTNKTLDDDTNEVHANTTYEKARNISGSTLTAGTPVYASGYNAGQDRTEIEPSDADVAATMPAMGIVEEDILNNANGHVIEIGIVENIDTTGTPVSESWSVGDMLYVSTIVGTLTNVRPTASNENVQYIAIVTRSHATLGRILVQGAGRVNDIPNDIATSDILIPLGTGTPTIDKLEEYLNNTGSSGYFTGGVLSDGGSGTLDVAAGSGFIRTTNDDNAQLVSFKWSASSTIAVTDNTTQYVYVDDSGVISLSTSEFLETPDKILIGVVTDEGAAIESVFQLGVRLEEGIGQAGRFMRGVHGIARNKRVGGLIFGQSGDANRDITMTAGQLEWGRTSYTMTSFDTSGADTFTTYSANGQEDAVASQWPNEQYDNAGTLTAMTNNRWANLFFWLEPNDKIIMVYGRAEFVSEAGAEAEGVPSSSLPTRISETGLLATRFTFQKSANTADIESAFDQLFANAAVSNHANLATLAWTSAGHTGTASRIAGFDGAGAANELTAGRSLALGASAIDADAELYTVTKTIIIETPTSSDNFIMFHVELGMQVTAAHAIVEDATNATVQFLQCDSAGDNCTEITSPIVAVVTGAADDGVIDAPDLDVDDYVRCNITATSGTPGAVTATLTMTMDD